jgi:hypothetical protein
MRSDTRERFRHQVVVHGGSAAAALALGCSRSYVDMIAKGQRRPGMRVARVIQAVFDIAMEDWLEVPPPAPPRRPHRR